MLRCIRSESTTTRVYGLSLSQPCLCYSAQFIKYNAFHGLVYPYQQLCFLSPRDLMTQVNFSAWPEIRTHLSVSSSLSVFYIYISRTTKANKVWHIAFLGEGLFSFLS